MADIVSAFPTSIAMSDSGVQRVAEAYVYAATDLAFATPLAITDLQGVPLTGGKLTTTTGQFPQFKAPPGVTQVLVRSGGRATLLTDLSVFAGASMESASLAAQKAGDAETARIAAVAAQQAAVAAAAVLQALANHQGAPLIEDPAEPGTFRILNPASIREDPAEPGTFLMGATT